MRIIIVLFVLAIIFIAVFVYGDKHNGFPDWITCVSLALTVISMVTFSALIVVATCNSITKETEYQNALYEKQVIEFRIENKESNSVGNEMLYDDIVEFNNSLREHKKWSGNPWTNVFWNDRIASIDYIVFE